MSQTLDWDLQRNLIEAFKEKKKSSYQFVENVCGGEKFFSLIYLFFTFCQNEFSGEEEK